MQQLRFCSSCSASIYKEIFVYFGIMSPRSHFQYYIQPSQIRTLPITKRYGGYYLYSYYHLIIFVNKRQRSSAAKIWNALEGWHNYISLKLVQLCVLINFHQKFDLIIFQNSNEVSDIISRVIDTEPTALAHQILGLRNHIVFNIYISNINLSTVIININWYIAQLYVYFGSSF